MALTNKYGFDLPDVNERTTDAQAKVNRILEWLDALQDIDLMGHNVNDPPGSPSAGDLYTVGDTPTGAWALHAGKFALRCQDGTWDFMSNPSGWIGWSDSVSAWRRWNGTTYSTAAI